MDLNIKLAWERLKYDIGKRHFLDYRFQLDLISNDLPNWLLLRKTEFDSGKYNPSQICVCEIPKGKGLIRPGAQLTLEDALFYIALLTECYVKVYEKVKWSQNFIDFSYAMSDEPQRKEWFVNQFKGWANFRDQSIKKIEEGYSYVIFTDITGFYENIDISLLLSDLRNCNIDNQIVDQISRCLNKWAPINKGVPQGQSPSDILAKLYMNAVDLGLKNAGYIHLRYVDDIRIFCKTKSDAKKSLIELSQLLRKRGLNLQSAKTKILDAVDANIEIESIFPIINRVATQLRKETIKVTESPYGDEYEEYDPDAEISEDSERVLEETFRSYFSEAEESKFDKSLFHYLLNRLKEAGNSIALDYCLSILESHPEETKYILDYSKSVSEIYDIVYDTKKRMVKIILEFLHSTVAIYDYQNYQLINWLFDNIETPDDTLMTIIRKLAFDNNRPYYLQRASRIFLSKFGDDADIERIENQYSIATNEIERSDLICCLGKLEKSRRNTFLGRIKNDGYLIELAVSYLKKG